MGSISPDEQYSVKEVGGFIGFGRDTVIRRIKAGHLKAFVLPAASPKRKRTYSSRRIRGSEVLRYLQEHTDKK